MEAVERAVQRQQYKTRMLEKLGCKKSEVNREVGLRQATIHSLERELNGRIMEIVVTPEAISWKRPCKIEEAISMLRARSKDLSMIILNLLQPQEQWEYVIMKDQMDLLEAAAIQAGIPILKFTRREVSTNDEGCIKRNIQLGHSYNMMNTYEVDGEPSLMAGSGEITVGILQCGRSNDWCENVFEKWSNNVGKTINNMYKQSQEQRPWICPICESEGKRINRFYGQCTNTECLIIATEDSIQDGKDGSRNKEKGRNNNIGKSSCNQKSRPH